MSVVFERLFRRLLWLLGCWLLSQGLLQGIEIPALNFQRYDSEDGLPAAYVRRILQDSRGFMWLATNDGLVRYDGRHFQHFRHQVEGTGSLSGSSVWDMVEDKAGNLWIATEGGLDLWRRDLERFEAVPLKAEPMSGPRSRSVRHVLLDGKDRLWICTDTQGLQCLDREGGEPRRVELRDEEGRVVERDNLESVFIDSGGDLWIGTWRSGLLRCDSAGRLLRQYQFSHSAGAPVPENSIRDVAEDKQGRLWIATEKGLRRLDPRSGELRTYLHDEAVEGSLSQNFLEDVFVDSKGLVWVGTSAGGLNLYDPDKDQFVVYRSNAYNPRSLASNTIRHIHEDVNGDLWTGHYPSGVSLAKRVNDAFLLIRKVPGDTNSLAENSVWSFAEGADGRLWIGTDSEGVDCWDPRSGAWKHHRHDSGDPRSLSANAAITLLMDRAGKLWVGTWNGGLNRMDPKTGACERFSCEPGDSGSVGHRHIKHLLEDRSGRLWVSTDGGGISRFLPESGTFKRYTQDLGKVEGLNSNVVWCVTQTRDGRLVAGTQEGLALYDEQADAWRRYRKIAEPRHPLNQSSVFSLLETSDGSLWVGTASEGLYRLDLETGANERLGPGEGLASESIRSLIEDGLGFLWIATNQGLTRMELKTRQCWNFSQGNGLPGVLFLRHSAIRRKDGQLMFGGPGGFSVVNPRLLSLDTKAPKVVLTRLELFNQLQLPGLPDSVLERSITETSSLRLPLSANVVSLQFSALSFGGGGNHRYLYKLEGFDQGWRPAGAEQRANYTNLAAGDYVFRVQAISSEGNWRTEAGLLELSVVPPFYRTTWFSVLSIALALVATVLVSRRFLHRKLQARLREAEQERLLAEERQKSLEQRAKYEQQLAQIQKMDSIGRLAGGIAHDLNNMILPILGFSELAILDLPAGNPARESLGEITRAAERSRDLVRQLLAFARKQAMEMRVMNLNTVITGFLSMLRRTLREDIAITTKLADSLPNVKADAGQMEQILLNLAVNAQDAMPSGGGLFIETSVVELKEGFVGGEEGFSPGRFVMLSVSDTGTGIPKEVLPHILEPFFTTKEAGKGTGLGLATVYGIVRQHSGFLKIYSEEGRGTTLRVYLPIADEPAQESLPQMEDSLLIRGTETLLITEDDPQVRRLSCQVLRRAGYEVLEAASIQEALAIAQTHGGTIHLLLTDIILPDGNGKDLHQRLSTIRPGLQILFMSGYTSDVIMHHGVLEAGVQFIQKPFNVGVLLRKVRDLLDVSRLSLGGETPSQENR